MKSIRLTDLPPVTRTWLKDRLGIDESGDLEVVTIKLNSPLHIELDLRCAQEVAEIQESTGV